MRSAALVLALALAAPSPALAAHKPAPALVAPAFHLPTRTGAVDSDSLRGRLVLLDFWASWCGPCRQSFPWMSGLQAKYGPRGLAIVAVNLDKQQELADTFLARFPAAFTVAFDPAGGTAEAYKVMAMPTSFLISTDGHVLARHAGYDPKRAASFETLIQEALPR